MWWTWVIFVLERTEQGGRTQVILIHRNSRSNHLIFQWKVIRIFETNLPNTNTFSLNRIFMMIEKVHHNEEEYGNHGLVTVGMKWSNFFYIPMIRIQSTLSLKQWYVSETTKPKVVAILQRNKLYDWNKNRDYFLMLILHKTKLTQDFSEAYVAIAV